MSTKAYVNNWTVAQSANKKTHRTQLLTRCPTYRGGGMLPPKKIKCKFWLFYKKLRRRIYVFFSSSSIFSRAFNLIWIKWMIVCYAIIVGDIDAHFLDHNWDLSIYLFGFVRARSGAPGFNFAFGYCDRYVIIDISSMFGFTISSGFISWKK